MNRHLNGLTRRDLVKASTAATATFAGLASATVTAQTPATSQGVDPASLEALSTGLVGGGNINTGALPILAALIESDPASVSALPELAGLSEFTIESVGGLSEDARRLSTNILQFWYLGQWDNAPVEERADLFFSLVSWQTLSYSTQPTLCKAFGYWAQDVGN